MLRPATEYRGLSIQAKDGDLGSVDDLFFDDESWTIRYVVVDTGTILPGRHVLISPLAVTGVDRDSRTIALSLTRQQIEKAPGIDTDRPVSRQEQLRQEAIYHNYYGWRSYWGGPGLWGAAMIPTPIPPAAPGGHPGATRPEDEVIAAAERMETGDPHLRSVQEVLGYYIEATDGDIGHVEDFLLDDSSWAVRYMLVDTKNWWPGKKTLVAPDWIRSIRWTDSRVQVDLSREAVKRAPEYDPTAPVSRDYETRLYGAHGRVGYWTEEGGPQRRRRA